MYEFHAACEMQPDMTAESFSALCESIKRGYQEDKPIGLYQGKIIDGRHRYKACMDVGATPTFFHVLEPLDPYLYVYDVHKGRRHYLSKEQQALVELPILEASEGWQEAQQLIKDEANRARAVAMQGVPYAPKGESRKPDEKVVPQSEAPPRTKKKKKPNRETAAKANRIGVSRAAVERAQTIQSASPDLADKVRKGEMPATKAIQEIKKAAIVEQLECVKAREVEAPTGLYDVIVIDPPWPMKKIERDKRPNQVKFDYPTMSEEELVGMEVPADDDCHIWLWTTHKFLPMAFRLLDAWGIKYVCTFVWHKPGGFQPVGLPQYNCEFALYARKGAPKFIDTKALPTCFTAQRAGHSEKPDEFYDVLRRVTAGRRLDMFNRRKIAGFDVWGNES